MPEYDIVDDGSSPQNQKGKAIASILPEINRSDMFIVLCCKFLHENKNQFNILRWAEEYSEQDMISMLSFLFAEEYLTEEMISKAWSLVKKEKENDS